jgi:Domain of unknown function (DUF4440)
MQTDDHSDDVRAIEALIARQFASLNWASGTSAVWEAFAADFFADASLYPAARPVKRQTVEGFVERMKGLSETKLHSFKETLLGAEIRVFGNVAIAAAACQMVENETVVNRGVEMLLLVKDDGAWRIVSQAWDAENPSKPIPPDLLRDAEGK